VSDYWDYEFREFQVFYGEDETLNEEVDACGQEREKEEFRGSFGYFVQLK
jgi:hypothetical protein